MRKEQIWLMLMLMTLVGCASVSEVSSVGRDTYSVASSMSGNYPSWPEVKGLAIKRANEFCDKENKTMTIVDWETHGARGWTPLNAELRFQCLSKEVQLSNSDRPRLTSGEKSVAKSDAAKNLEQLNDLRDRGLITQEEFDKKRKEILDRF